VAKSWSQHDLANEAGARQALISSLEAGEANPTVGDIAYRYAAINWLVQVKASKTLEAGQIGARHRLQSFAPDWP
jgi:predicted transcriptional regulator